jgi:hypothetical protein
MDNLGTKHDTVGRRSSGIIVVSGVIIILSIYCARAIYLLQISLHTNVKDLFDGKNVVSFVAINHFNINE